MISWGKKRKRNNACSRCAVSRSEQDMLRKGSLCYDCNRAYQSEIQRGYRAKRRAQAETAHTGIVACNLEPAMHNRLMKLADYYSLNSISLVERWIIQRIEAEENRLNAMRRS